MLGDQVQRPIQPGMKDSENKGQDWAITHTGPPGTVLNLVKTARPEWLLIVLFSLFLKENCQTKQ